MGLARPIRDQYSEGHEAYDREAAAGIPTAVRRGVCCGRSDRDRHPRRGLRRVPDRQGSFNNATIRALDTNNSPESNGLFQCRSVLPNAGTGLTVEQVQQDQQQNLRQAVKSASCMRAHGIENFADPSGSTQASGVNWQPVLQAGLNLNTPSYKAAFHACQTRADHIIPPPLAPGAVAPSPPPQGSGSGPSGSPAP
jgi:hypothetical protein